MIEPRWCQVRKLTPVHKNSELVNNVPGWSGVRLTGKVKDNRVQIDHPYRGWISTASIVEKISVSEALAAQGPPQTSLAVSPTLQQLSLVRTASVSPPPESCPPSPTSSTSSAADSGAPCGPV